MKTTTLFAIVLVMTLFTFLSVADTPTEAAPTPFNNLTCPVSGEAAKTAYIGVYDGKAFRFCSEEDRDAFLADPDAYRENLPNKGEIVDLANTVCPVSGEPATSDAIVIDGTRVHVSSRQSLLALRRFPTQYLARAKRIVHMTEEEIAEEFRPRVQYNNRFCIVTGEPAVRTIVAEHNDIIYRFSTQDARAAFTADPEKYLAALPNNGQIIDMDNDFCPDDGGPIDKTLFTIVDGHKIYAGCRGCLASVERDPDKYIPRVKMIAALTPEERVEQFGDEGCDGTGCGDDHDDHDDHDHSDDAECGTPAACATCPSATATGGCSVEN